MLGLLRCIDCHLAGYGTVDAGIDARFHNMNEAANAPYSCSGAYGTDAICHEAGLTSPSRQHDRHSHGGPDQPDEQCKDCDQQ